MQSLEYLTGNIKFTDWEVKKVCDGILKASDCMEDKRRAALVAWHIERGYSVRPAEVSPAGYSDFTYRLLNADYLVLTEEEAKNNFVDSLKQSFWTLSTDYLSERTGADKKVFNELVAKGESANDAVAAIIDETCGLDDFIENALEFFPLGYFLESDDWQRIDYYYRGFFIYRVQ
jgi:hypothetical protein